MMARPDGSETPRLTDVTLLRRQQPQARHPHLHSAATPPPPPRPPQPVIRQRARDASYDHTAAIDWSLVTRIRLEVAQGLSQHFSTESDTALFELFTDVSRDELERVGRQHIQRRLEEERRTVIQGGENWSPEYALKLERAVWDAFFGLGRFQPLVDDDTITDVHIDGYDNVWVFRTDGSRGRWEEPLVESDQELIEWVSYLASQNGRAYDRANPRLRLSLGHTVRLTAVHPPVSRRPSVKLRMHRTIGVTLDSLADKGMLSPHAATFLKAAVKGHRNLVVAGDRGVGKTTLLRALAAEIPPEEPLVVIEGERELHLDLIDGGARHPIATSLEGQPGTGRPDVTGRRAGEVTAEDLVEDSMRLGAQRVIVGEVLGAEIVAMFEAMQSGAGSLSTLHSRSAADAISRMAGLALKSGPVNPDWVNREILAHIDLIVYIRKARDARGQLHRWVSDIVEVTTSGADHIAVTHPIFATPARDRYEATLVGKPTDPQMLDDLHWAGLPENFFLHMGGGQA